jgi:hypothetical protein
VRPAPDNYFVRLDPVPLDAGAPAYTEPPARERRNRRRRTHKRGRGRTTLLVLLVCALVGWFGWAQNRPGGVSGTINGFIDHVRGDVQDVSTGPDLHKAVRYFQAQYEATGSYPNPTEEQLSAAGISIDVVVASCGASAVVLQTLTVSHLLVGGKDLGEVSGKVACPSDLTHPAPWR